MKILVTAQLTEEALSILRQYGEVRCLPFRDTGRPIAGDELVKELDGVTIFITELDPVTADVIDQLNSVKIIYDCRAGPVNVDVEAATRRGIPILNVPARNVDAVAELTVCLMVMLGRKVLEAIRELKDREVYEARETFFWRAYIGLCGTELWSKTVGIIGLGAVGRAVALRLPCFGARAIAFDPYVSRSAFHGLGVESVSLDELLGRSDFVTLHTRVTGETKGMLGEREFGLMKPTAYLLNLGRGALIDELALARAIQNEQIAGAGVDVFTKEPPPLDHPLLHLDNVIALPHIGGNTFEVADHQSMIVVRDLERLMRGETPQYCVNPEVLADFDLSLWESES